MQCCVDEVCKLVVVSGETWHSVIVDSDTAVSLIATLSEDPASWLEVLAYWPRYRTPIVLQDLSELRCTPESKRHGAQQDESWLDDDGWLFIDFDQKRIVTSPSLRLSGRDHVFDLFSDDQPEKRWPLSIHLPPWWELLDAVMPQAIARARSTPLIVPTTNRDFLYGRSLVEFIARQVLARKSAGLREIRLEDRRRLHALTVDIHREWLMTPREELRGQMPRQLLHGAHHWISRVVEGQALRVQEGGPLIALPTDVQGFETAAMGSEEVVIYFDLCRYLIGYGWEWLSRTLDPQGQVKLGFAKTEQELFPSLVEYLAKAKAEFMSSPYEGGSSPNFIIECSRRRVPRSPNMVIEGMDEQEPSQHISDCECPLCAMMDDGTLGLSFVALDGYHLELDEEFAFSLFETHQQWQEESLFLDDESEETEDTDEHKIDDDKGINDCDEFASAWDGIRSSEPLPGDPLGHIKLAFMLAEIVAYLQSRKVDPQIVLRLNSSFQQYRRADYTARKSAKRMMIEQLELLAVRYPQLIPRVADFQSHLDLAEHLLNPQTE